MCSRGSVIPLFISQIRNNQPITVTNPYMTRFLMDLNEAVDLVLFAFEHGHTGDLFIQKSPACTIGTLAEAVKKIFKPDAILILGDTNSNLPYEGLDDKMIFVTGSPMKELFCQYTKKLSCRLWAQSTRSLKLIVCR